MDKHNKSVNSKILIELFTTFFKIGLFTFGGGYAMIPLIQKEIADNKKWTTEKDILDIIAIAESTPGPISVNTATFIGFKLAKILGAILATLGLILPSFVIIILISLILQEFESLKVVQYAFWGVRAGILALIIKAFFTMYKACPKNIISYIIMIIAFLAVAIFNINALIVIVICALIGLVYSIFVIRRSEK